MDTFQTTYGRDYVPKVNKYLRSRKMELIPSEYRDPLSEPYIAHINIDKSDPAECVEEIESYYEKAKEEYPTVKRYMPDEKEPIDKKSIKKDKVNDGHTTYEVSYCDIEKEIATKEYEKKNALQLPLDIFIPLTTQNSGFRQPKMINPRAYERDPVPKALNNLLPNYKVREIMKVTTGWSDYTNKIGILGEKIIAQGMHGPVHHDFRGK